MDLRSSMLSRALLLAVASAVVPLACAAQATSAGSRPPGPSRLDLYGEFGYFHPIDSDLYNQEYQPLRGAVAGIAAYFNRSFGIQAEFSKFPDNPDYCFGTAEAGLVYRHPIGRLIPFMHFVGGGAHVGPSYAHGGSLNACTWGWAVSSGLGIDYVLPAAALHNRVAIRPIEADFHFTDVDFGRQVAPLTLTGGAAQITAYRLSAGLVFRLGETAPELPAAYGCEVQPVKVFPGDPIAVTGKTINLDANKRLKPVYTWTTTGGKIAGTTENAFITTAGLAPGDYTVTGRVSEGSKPSQHADCSASFRVEAFEPPTLACSADPSSVVRGGSSTITAVGRSPQNRPLNYSYAVTAGQISGSGAISRLATADAGPGIITVTCNVVDDTGESASATAIVTVVAAPVPPAPPAPVTQNLCGISFERDKRHPVRVDNEAKACLDDIALALNRDSDAELVVVGNHDPREKPEAAAERTLNVKQYLTDEKGIDPSRIKVRIGESTRRAADNILVPSGATWDPAGTTSFDPASLKRHGQPYAPTPR